MLATASDAVNGFDVLVTDRAGKLSLHRRGYHRFVAKTPTKIAVDRYIGAELARMNTAGQSWRDLGKIYRISHVYARDVAQGAGAGQRLEGSWAEKHHGGSVDELRRAAETWAREKGLWDVEAVKPSTLADPRAWLNDLALDHVRMRPAIEMGLDGGIPPRFVRDFVARHDGEGPDLPSAQWWNLLQVEHAQEKATAGQSEAHARLREIAHEETANGRFVSEDMLTALRAAHAEEPEGGWLAAIDRERVRYGKEGLRGDYAKRKASTEEKKRRRAAKQPAATDRPATVKKRAAR